MRNKLFPILTLAAAGFLAGPAVRSAEVTPIGNLGFFGGQSFTGGAASSLGGNANVIVTPVVAFSDTWSVFPTYSGFYQGTRDVQELAGGGTLFQDSTSHNLLLKSVHKLGDGWKLKPSVGAGMEWLRETEDEDWGEGLFDYRKVNGGLEAEYNWSREVGGRVSYDYYQLAFPNYQSLESAQDPTLSRELVGEDVLNSANHMVGLGAWTPLPGNGRLEGNLFFSRRDFADQPVVAASGDLTGTERGDTGWSLSAGLANPFPLFGLKMVGELGLGLARQDSNQNHYDAKKTTFIGDYYDFTQWSVGPRVSTRFGSWQASLGGSYEQRDYDERLVQDVNGDYGTEKLSFSTLTAQLGLAYPLSKNMFLRFQTTLAWGDGNTDYDKVYAYNYKIANYLLGFSYEY